MAKRKTNEEFLREVKELRGDEYTFLDKYINYHSKLCVRHNKCGYEYFVSPAKFLSGRRCPQCAGNLKKTTDVFRREVKNAVGNEYTFLGEYVNNETKIQVKHNTCGNVYSVTPVSFLGGSRCPRCYGSFSKSNEDFLDEVFALRGKDYTFLDKYNGAHAKLRVRHNTCDHDYSVTPRAFLNGARCPKCFGGVRKDPDQFIKDVADACGTEYTFLSPYKNNKAHIPVRHNKCGFIYEVSPDNFLRGRRCPRCSSSHGESAIFRLLEKEGVSFRREYRFLDCKGDMHPLPFDFAVMQDDHVLFLVEFDGIQHYEPVDYFGGQGAFEKRKRYDEIKSAYCAERGIPLVRIPYWQYDEIEGILEKAIREYRAKPAGKPRERVETRWSSLTRKEWQNTHERRAP